MTHAQLRKSSSINFVLYIDINIFFLKHRLYGTVVMRLTRNTLFVCDEYDYEKILGSIPSGYVLSNARIAQFYSNLKCRGTIITYFFAFWQRKGEMEGDCIFPG